MSEPTTVREYLKAFPHDLFQDRYNLFTGSRGRYQYSPEGLDSRIEIVKRTKKYVLFKRFGQNDLEILVKHYLDRNLHLTTTDVVQFDNATRGERYGKWVLSRPDGRLSSCE